MFEICILCKFADVLQRWLLFQDVHLPVRHTEKSTVDTSAGILKGCPFGEVAILWRKGLFNTLSVINCNSNRLAAIKATLIDNRSVMIFSVYIQTDNSENFLELFW